MIYPETEVIRLTGYTRQQLRNLRLGRKTGKYEYPPVLIEGKHWQKFGGAVAYTEAGLKKIRSRAKDQPKAEIKNAM